MMRYRILPHTENRYYVQYKGFFGWRYLREDRGYDHGAYLGKQLLVFRTKKDAEQKIDKLLGDERRIKFERELKKLADSKDTVFRQKNPPYDYP